MLLAFDISGTFIKYALVDEAYQVSDASRVSDTSCEEFWELLSARDLLFRISHWDRHLVRVKSIVVGFVFKRWPHSYLRNIPLATHPKIDFFLTVLNDGMLQAWQAQ